MSTYCSLGIVLGPDDSIKMISVFKVFEVWGKIETRDDTNIACLMAIQWGTKHERDGQLFSIWWFGKTLWVKIVYVPVHLGVNKGYLWGDWRSSHRWSPSPPATGPTSSSVRKQIKGYRYQNIIMRKCSVKASYEMPW